MKTCLACDGVEIDEESWDEHLEVVHGARPVHFGFESKDIDFPLVGRKRPNDVLLKRIDEDFTVLTNEGIVNGNHGDFLAYDEASGHMWPVSADYLEMHYDIESRLPQEDAQENV